MTRFLLTEYNVYKKEKITPVSYNKISGKKSMSHKEGSVFTFILEKLTRVKTTSSVRGSIRVSGDLLVTSDRITAPCGWWSVELVHHRTSRW